MKAQRTGHEENLRNDLMTLLDQKAENNGERALTFSFYSKH